MIACLYNQEPLTVRMALKQLVKHKHFQQKHQPPPSTRLDNDHNTVHNDYIDDHLDVLGIALINVLSSSSLNQQVKMIAASLVHKCVAALPYQAPHVLVAGGKVAGTATPLDNTWIRTRALNILSNAMQATFVVTSSTSSPTITATNAVLLIKDQIGTTSTYVLSSLIPFLNTYALFCRSSTSSNVLHQDKKTRAQQEETMFETVLLVCNCIMGGKAQYDDSQEECAFVPPLALLQVHVLKQLALHVHRTPRNRSMLSTIITTTRWLASSMGHRTTSSHTAAKGLDLLLQRAITLFFTVWYPRPCDALVRLLPSTVFPHEQREQEHVGGGGEAGEGGEGGGGGGGGEGGGPEAHARATSMLALDGGKERGQGKEEEEGEEEEEEEVIVGYLGKRRKLLKNAQLWVNDNSLLSKNHLYKVKKKYEKKMIRMGITEDDTTKGTWTEDMVKKIVREEEYGGKPNDMGDIKQEQHKLARLLEEGSHTGSQGAAATVFVPALSELRLRGSATLVYNTTSYTKTITLSNLSTTTTHGWVLQTHPGECPDGLQSIVQGFLIYFHLLSV